MHYTAILGMLILPVPTLIGFIMSSLRSSYGFIAQCILLILFKQMLSESGVPGGVADGGTDRDMTILLNLNKVKER